MFKNLLVIFLFFLSFLSFSQSNYIQEYKGNISKLSNKEKVDSIIALPFEIMNSQTVQAIELYKEGLIIAKLLKDDNRTGELHNLLGLAYYYKGDYEASVQSVLDAISFFEKAGNNEKIGAAYATLGHQMKRRNLPKAFEYMRKGIKILETVENKLPLNAAYNNFGVLYVMNKDIDSALYFYYKGLDIVKNVNDSLAIPYSLNNIGEAYVKLGDIKKAKSFYDEAFKIRQLRNDRNGLAENYGLYGDYYFKQNQFEKAIENYLNSLAISEEINYTWLVQMNAEQLAIAYEKIGDYKNSLIYRKKFQAFKDQLLNEQSNKTIAELEIKFDTERKEKEIAQQQERINKHLAEVKQRNVILVGLSIAFILLIVLAVLIYRQQRYKQERLREENKLKDRIAEEQTKNKLQEERLRISRDLHDNIGSQLTFLTSSMDNMKFISKEEKVTNKLNDLTTFTRSTISQLRDTIWAMNKESLTIDDLQGRLLNYIEEARKSTEEVIFDLHKTASSDQIVFSATQGVNLFRIVQESINNALKYASPSKIEVDILLNPTEVIFTVKDNGIGFSPEEIVYGNGLKNMEQRAKDIGAVFQLKSIKGEGTTILIRIEKDKLNDV